MYISVAPSYIVIELDALMCQEAPWYNGLGRVHLTKTAVVGSAEELVQIALHCLCLNNSPKKLHH